MNYFVAKYAVELLGATVSEEEKRRAKEGHRRRSEPHAGAPVAPLAI